MSLTLGAPWHYPLPGSPDQNLYPLRLVNAGEHWGIFCKAQQTTLLEPLYECIETACTFSIMSAHLEGKDHLFVVLTTCGKWGLFDVNSAEFVIEPHFEQDWLMLTLALMSGL